MTTQKEISATEKLLDLIRASPPPSAVETTPSQATTDQRSGLRLEETGVDYDGSGAPPASEPTSPPALGPAASPARDASLLATTAADALSREAVYRGLINAGEVSGTMVEVFKRLTYILEHEYKVKRDINSALAYPKMVVAPLIGAFFFLLTFVIPKFVAIFTKAGIELPLPTRLCLVMYHGLLTYWPLMLGVSMAILAGFKMYFKTEQGAIQRDLFLIRLPILGQLFIKSAMSRFASILAILLASGINVLSSFEILSATIGNAAIAKEFDMLATRMSEGHGISAPLRASRFFPPMVVNMIAISEESGALDEMLRQVASHYDEEVEYAVAGLSEAIGPILIVLLTVVVGFFALAIFLPMWDLTKMVK